MPTPHSPQTHVAGEAKRPTSTWVGRRLAGLALVAGLAGACGLSDNEQARMNLHYENSRDFHNRGSWLQALDQANKALALDEDLLFMQLIRGDCLVKLGKQRDEPSMMDEGLDLLSSLCRGPGEESHNAWLALGRAHVARSLLNDAEVGRIERRLASDFLDPTGRAEEEAWLARETEAEIEHLRAAESALRRVLAFELQGDNLDALVDLVVVLNRQGGRQDEAIETAQRAVELLIESNALTRRMLQNDQGLSSEGKLALQRRVDANLDKEWQLRDIIVTIEYNRGALQAALNALDAVEDRQLMRPEQYLNRAGIHERLHNDELAVSDLEQFLAARARVSQFDAVAAEIYDRIAALQARSEADAR